MSIEDEGRMNIHRVGPHHSVAAAFSDHSASVSDALLPGEPASPIEETLMNRALYTAVLLSALTGCVAVTNPDRARDQAYRRDWRDDHDSHYWERRRDSQYWYHYRTDESRHNWRRGERLPAAYYSYRINDYRRCGLRSPPRGAHWVRVDRDAVLAAIATGIVLDVVYNAFY